MLFITRNPAVPIVKRNPPAPVVKRNHIPIDIPLDTSIDIPSENKSKLIKPIKNLMLTKTRAWKKLKDHAEQIRAWLSRKRFNIIPAGRRSGKTEIIGKRKQVLRFMLCHDKRFPQFHSTYDDPRYFIGAPTRDQVKRIYWQDVKSLVPVGFLSKPPNESNLITCLISKEPNLSLNNHK